MFKDFNTLGHICATYLDSHGYGAAEVMRIILALSKLTIEGFIVRAEGCGMLIIELEWFWDLEWFTYEIYLLSGDLNEISCFLMSLPHTLPYPTQQEIQMK